MSKRSSHTEAVLSFALFCLGNHSFFPLRIVESAKDTGTAVFSHKDFSVCCGECCTFKTGYKGISVFLS